ncbi:hypothetical protein [Cupriavidus basilensis]|uniref:Uncharacterized protein n=1 Tax=Cupriavidus basilensis TaxID=68895 RepID=A0A643FMH2_9BURK|nr:hypothetical protein [Cupriavidus basilensis]QOT77898.1 hypothetical protein F7R26_007700 [Cupriavidus basilensis]
MASSSGSHQLGGELGGGDDAVGLFGGAGLCGGANALGFGNHLAGLGGFDLRNAVVWHEGIELLAAHQNVGVRGEVIRGRDLGDDGQAGQEPHLDLLTHFPRLLGLLAHLCLRRTAVNVSGMNKG